MSSPSKEQSPNWLSDCISAVPVKPYFSDAQCVIYNAACESVLPFVPKASLLLTDPPYEMVATGGGIGAQRKYLNDIEGFTDGGFDFSLLDRAENWMAFCAKKQLPRLLAKAEQHPRWMLVTWNKPNPTPLSNGNYLPDTEYVVHAFQPNRCFGEFRDKSRFIVYPAQQHNLHPNEKPLRVMVKMIAVGTMPGETILDPFMGSGTTLVAAKLEGRKAVGIEISEKYCEIAANRLRQKVLNFEEVAP
jgi:site-specific DNA-methyltransferase (adenine-specific)